MRRRWVIAVVVFVAVAGWGLFNTQAWGEGFGIDVRIDVPAPVVVVPVEVVGGHRILYDADLRLRLAQADEWRAHEALEAARVREGEIAVALADAQAGGAGGDVEGLRRRLAAAEHRAAGDVEYVKAAEVLNDNDALAEARDDLAKHSNEAAALRDAIARAGGGGDAARLAADLEVAHEAVYAAEVRLAEFNHYVCAALHDRDEALWLLFQDQILAGTCDPLVCGFQIDIGFLRAHRHDAEAIHAHLVHDSGYWQEHPDMIVTRVEQVDRIKEVSSIREIERVKEVRVTEIEKVEKVVKVEDIKRVHESVKVETERAVNEHKERDTAAKEGRKANVTNFVADTHPNVAEKLRHGSGAATATPETGDKHGDKHHDAGASGTTGTPDTGGKHHDAGSSGTTETPDTGGKKHHDAGTTETPDTGGKHHDAGSSGTTETPDTGGKKHHDSGSTGTTETPDTGGKHHDAGSTGTTETPDTGGKKHHDAGTTETPDTSGKHHDAGSTGTTGTPDTGGKKHHDSGGDTGSTTPPTSRPSH